MSSISSGTTSTTGYVVSSDTTGALVLKTGASATTAVTIDASQNVTFAGSQTLSAGTANGVAYLNGSKVLTSGSALVFDGTNLGVGDSPSYKLDVAVNADSANSGIRLLNNSAGSSAASVFRLGTDQGNIGFLRANSSTNTAAIGGASSVVLGNGLAFPVVIATNGVERLRVDSSGNLGIGTSSPSFPSGSGLAIYNSSVPRLKFSNSTTGDGSTDGTNLLVSGSDFYIQQREAASVIIATNGADRATIDSAGNLGLGVTPSGSWGTQAFMLGKSGASNPTYPFIASTDSQAVLIGSNSYWDGTNFKAQFGGAGVVAMHQKFNYNAITWHTAPAVTTGNNQTFTQAMTLDADGDLGVGITSPLYKIHSSGTVARKYTTPGTTGSPAEEAGFVYADDGSTPVAGIWFFNTFSSGNTTQMAFKTRNSAGTVVEAVRIDAGQNVLIGATSFADGSNVFRISGSTISSGSSVTTTRTRLEFNSSGLGTVGSISTNGSATTYSTSSDYRLKNTIAPMTGALAKVALLKPCTYKWNADGSDGEGFIAHELAEVCPQAVVGEKDAIETYVDEDGNEQTRSVYQGIDTSFLVATLTAAIQEQQLLIQQLQADVAILKGVQQ